MEKAERAMDSLEGALVHAEGDDFPTEVYEGVTRSIRRVLDFTEEEGMRLQQKVLLAGGLEPGRVKRG
jgi:uncharacterized protein YcaQ